MRNIYFNSDGYLQQFELFGESGEIGPAEPPLRYVPGLLPGHRELFDMLARKVDWRTRYGTRESTTWGESYHYRKRSRTRHPWPDFLLDPATAIGETFGFLPNNCVANHYPDGEHTIGFHSDEGMEMRGGTGVVIISLGALRHLVLRRIDDPSVRYHYALAPGSALHMTDASQAEWQHGILREAGAGRRISLSFRCIREDQRAEVPAH